MKDYRGHNTSVLVSSVFFLVLLFPVVIYSWGYEGHYTVCKIAQSRLSDAAADAVKELLPGYAENDLARVCIWADRVKFRYGWSRPLHYINTPQVCNYKYNRDCKNEKGEADMCVAGAINNYTSQLLSYHGTKKAQHNLTEALLFLSHFMGDIHQPLHVGFADDKGGNTIDIHWYTRKQNLHHVWDSNIIETAEEKYDSNLNTLIDAIQHNITKEWSDEIPKWETCAESKTTCPDTYASEGITAACDVAYKDVEADSTLEDDYFLSRLPTVYRRLAQGGVRLAATLNRIFV